MYACSNQKSLPMVKLLIEHNINPWTSLETNGANALTTAVKFEQRDSAMLLMHRGHDLITSYSAVVVRSKKFSLYYLLNETIP